MLMKIMCLYHFYFVNALLHTLRFYVIVIIKHTEQYN